MKKTRLSALLLTLALLICTIPATAAAATSPLLGRARTAPTFTDIKGTPYEKAARTVYETTLMEAGGKKQFTPDGVLTVAQVFAICARLHEFLTGGDGELPPPAKGKPWYQPFYDYLSKTLPAGNEADRLLWRAEVSCSRESFAALLADCLSAANRTLPVKNAITTLPDTADSRVLLLYNAGILAGSGPYGAFRGSDDLTRGQAAAMLARVIDPAQRLTFTVKPFALLDLLNLKSETVLFRIADTNITAGQCVFLLADGITKRPDTEPYTQTWAERFVQDSVRTAIGTEHLAKQLGISLTDADRAEAAQRIGALYGATQESRLWEEQRYFLTIRMKTYYGDANNPHLISAGYTDALAKLVNSLSVEPTPAYTALDLKQFRAALLASGFYTMSNLNPEDSNFYSQLYR